MTNTLETGGSERQFVTIANALNRDMFSVSLGCLQAIRSFLSEVEGVVPFRVGGSLFGFQSWRSRFALSRFSRRKGTALVQSFDFYSNLVLIPARFARSAARPGRRPQVVRIGVISRMNHKAKQHGVFFRVAARQAPRFPQLRFVLAEDGPLSPVLEALARQLELLDRVVFLGDPRDIPAVLTSLDVSVLPSSAESLSNIIMESMAAGVPVVAATVGGNPELVRSGRTGFLFTPGDEHQFAALITQPELRKQLGTSGQLRALAQYAIPQARPRYQDLFHGVLAEKGGMTPLPLQYLQPARTGQERQSH
jgi:glycosyltransferase involved in cell wall biosynthesis